MCPFTMFPSSGRNSPERALWTDHDAGRRLLLLECLASHDGCSSAVIRVIRTALHPDYFKYTLVVKKQKATSPLKIVLKERNSRKNSKEMKEKSYGVTLKGGLPFCSGDQTNDSCSTGDKHTTRRDVTLGLSTDFPVGLGVKFVWAQGLEPHTKVFPNHVLAHLPTERLRVVPSFIHWY